MASGGEGNRSSPCKAGNFVLAGRPLGTTSTPPLAALAHRLFQRRLELGRRFRRAEIAERVRFALCQSGDLGRLGRRLLGSVGADQQRNEADQAKAAEVGESHKAGSGGKKVQIPMFNRAVTGQREARD